MLGMMVPPAVLLCLLLALPALLPLVVDGLDNGLGLTPAMGYNTWDDFRCGGINASNLHKVADAMVAQGLPALGYRYVSLDDCWAKARDQETGVIIPDPAAFPDGMKAVADYIHSKGLLFGIYTDRGQRTCVGRPGSYGYEELDAKTYASWGVDYVKEVRALSMIWHCGITIVIAIDLAPAWSSGPLADLAWGAALALIALPPRTLAMPQVIITRALNSMRLCETL